jgi:transposase
VWHNRDVAKKGRRALEEERIHAVRLMEAGKSPGEIAEIMNVGRSTVFEWQQKYREGGLAALSTKFASGRPTTLSDQQMMRLYSLIEGNDPRQYSFAVALWTRQIVRDLIRQQFRVAVSLVTVGRILKKLGMSPQRPLYRAYQQDPDKVEAWKRETYPAIRAEAAEVGGSIFFADEAGLRTDHHAGRTWAPVGRTPVVTATGQRAGINMISAISPGGQVRFHLVEGSFTAATFIEFCKRLLHDATGPVFLIVDGHPAHRAKAVKDFVASTGGRLRLFFLPGYSPELNPDEWVWKNVKNDRVAKQVPMNKAELKSLALGALRRLQKLPHIVRGFFADPHLAYIHA